MASSLITNLVTKNNDPTGDPLSFTGKLSSLNTNLISLDSSLNSVNSTLLGAMAHQDQMNSIITSENTRINAQATSLKNAVQGQQRIINLNDSYRKRYGQYLKIAIAITVILLLVWIFKVIESRFPDAVPSFIYDLLTITVASLGLIYCYLVYSVIGKRDPLNYDQLNIAPPPNAYTDIATAGNAAPNSNKSTSGGDLLTCKEQSCCLAGTTWRSEVGGCVQGFTTLSQVSSNVEPMSSFEYTDYAPLK